MKLSKIALAGLLALSLGACAGGSSTAASSAPQSSAASSAASTRFTPGTYEGSAAGFSGEATPITVKVTLGEETIDSIEYTDEGETPTVGGMAIPKLVENVIAAQSTQIDGVSGATMSSNGFFAAVNSALESAGVDPASLEPLEIASSATDIEETTDVVIAGAGGAGMTAAITAVQAGKKVILLEKAAVVGGNSSRATGGMNAAETHYQKEQNIEDSVALYVSDTMKGGHDLNDPDLVQTLAENSAEAIDWLDSIGAPLSNVGQAGGASTKRQHRPVNDEGKILSVGTFLVEHLYENVQKLGIKVIFGAQVDEILMEDGKATGLHATGSEGEYITIHASSVIVTTGGFGSNPDLIVKYRPDLEGYVSTNAPTITGDAIAFLEAAGADFVDLDQIQIHPTVVQSDGHLISESLRGDGAILLNVNGERFTNELLTRDVVSANIIKEPESFAWLLINQTMYDESTVIAGYVSQGYMVKCDTVADLAKEINVDEETLQASIDKWAAACAAQKDEEFGREAFDAIKTDLAEGPYYVAKIAPGIHHCMGGVHINTNAEVIDTEGNVIPGLFAAGEVTGGVHGGNRLGGNAVADFTVFGRIAGTSAAAYAE